MDDLTDDEQFMMEIWDEATKEIEAFENERKRIADRILNAIGSFKGNEFLLSVKECMLELECSGELNLSRKFRGEPQNESFGSIKTIAVEQYSSGDSGDSFYGWIYITIRNETKLKPALYLQAHFAC